jgi:hypothetical protein
MPKFEKSFYKEDPIVTNRSKSDVAKFRAQHQITVQGTNIPRANSVNVPKASGPQDGSIFHYDLLSGFSAFLQLAILSIISLAFSVWFIYTESVNPAPVPKYMVLSPGTTGAIIGFLTCVVEIITLCLVGESYNDFVFHLSATRANLVSPWLSISNRRTVGLIKYIKALGAPWPFGLWILQQ